ncbi:hypothetical protein [Brevibacillus sp. MER 51]|uniref:hypothetical protein n=1 Tax=Brevibacillus sp. MER 51 TaxID=2939560 RepID=UPI00203A9789|nr:hypothetical protein [Brevibacillus sp. MER 51]MCM3145359.1 hypothetical protein [Brevibacillus sp. MER 51]
MTTIQMNDSSVEEVKHLFKVMKTHGVTCSLEFNRYKGNDPLIGIAAVEVDVELLEEGEIIVKMGEADFAFERENHSFGKLITDSQIMITIAENDSEYVVWFNSGVVPPEGIEEAKSYDDTKNDDDIDEPEFTEEEKKLAYFIRSLDFEAVLDAVSGIHREVDQSKNKAATHLRAGRIKTANAFDKRAANLEQLACLLGEANKDYNAHVCQVD